MRLDESYCTYKLLKVKGVGPVLVNKIMQGLSGMGSNLSDTLQEDSTVGVLRNWLDEDQIAQIKDFDPYLSKQIDEMKGMNAQFVCTIDADYPRILASALGNSTPPILSCIGNLKLLEMPSVGFCGSRKASEGALGVARDCVEQLVSQNIAIVSGYAAGIDQQVHIAALESGGFTIVVLPEGMLNFNIRRTLRNSWDWRRVLVISEFLPGDVWLSSRAMQRNKTIVGLSSVVFLIEAGKRGGSMDAGKRALKLNRRLYVPLYEDMRDTAAGNKELLSLGATPLLKNKRTGRANLDKLVGEIEDFRRSGKLLAGQLTFL